MTADPRRDAPRLSVTLPVLDNGHLLALALDALTRQTLPADRFEVIVVDDGSEPSLAPVADRFADRLPLTYLRHTPNRGRSVARNRAIGAARGDVVLFLDADQAAHPDLLRRHWEFHAGRDLRPGVLLGRAVHADWAILDALHRGETPTAAMVGDYRGDVRDPLLAAAHHRRDFVRAPWVYGHTNNASVDRASLVAVGGFDEAMVTWGGEDNELFYRLFHHHRRDPDLFALGDDAVSFDLPHFRMVPLLMAQLAENVRYIGTKHPRYDIEFFAYPGPWPASVRRIAWFEDALDAARTHGLARADRLPKDYLAELAGEDCLVTGYGASRLELGAKSVTLDHDAPPDERNLHLAGLLTPFPENWFARVVNVDMWRFWTPEDLSGLLHESLRIGRRVDFVRTERNVGSADLLPLPFVTDLDFLLTTVERYLDVRREQVGDVEIVSVRGAR
ncbi:glycosyltransferase [Micromonospora echinofusca]|uniref:Glycosyltransferase n=1 Tax=Micromonospora echinofusca TaxID=47858 RepID=A0ABS3VS40_MICEH|nr:glycosyltransferase [Micromonospora echinofusca]MBO4207336.1 glycosyltransferase [Micromonospora echinofusca]